MGASQDFHILEVQRLIIWGVFNLGVGLDTKMSPRRVAITKAQEELRLEFDVREERKRELKFLEKGGNPLDFKFSYAASISLQSTSLTDQLAEHEAKSSFAFAASPHGDSVESSGRPGDSMGKEPNIADNLLLFDRENSNPDGKKYIKRTGRRSNATSMELSSQADDHRNKKDLDNSIIFRLGAKGQAYARRNRSRSNRDTHSNKCPTLPSSCDDIRDAKESQGGIHEVVHVVSSILNSKLATSTAKGGEQRATTRTEKLQVVERNATPLEKAANDNATQPSQLIGKDAADSVGFLSALPQAIQNIRGITLDEKENDYGGSDANITNLCDNDMDAKKYVSGHVSEVVGTRNINACPEYISTGCLNVIADANDSSALRVAGSLDGDSKEQVACQGPSVDSREKCQLVDSTTHIFREMSLPTNFDNPVVQNKHETRICDRTDDQGEKRHFSNIDIVKDRKSGNFLGDRSQGINKYAVVARSSFGLTHEPSVTVSKKVSLTASELQNSEASQLKLAKKAHEDATLKKARIIEANLKRAGTLSKSYISSEKRYKCHWDFVLEEMSWMANDFMQERLWKATAAIQVCRWIASFGRSKFDQRRIFQKQRNIAETLAKAVMQFWHSAKAIHMLGESPNSMSEDWKTDSLTLSNINSLYTGKEQGVENRGRFVQQGIQGYALRFLQHISNMSNAILDDAPGTPDRITVASTLDISSDDQLSEEFLFYEVPPGAMHSYRELVQSQCTHNKKKANAMNQHDYEAFMCGSVGDGSRGSVFEEDEGETGTDILQGPFEGNFSFKITSKKRKKLQQKSKSQRFYKVGADSSYEPYPDRKYVSHSLSNMSKRPSSTLNVGAVPTKRTRTAPRQRIVSPFGARVTGAPQVTSRTDVSSGDTCSFQDGQISLHGGSLPWKNLEVESTVDFDRGLRYDSSDISTKPKKKRKPKHLGYKNSYLPDSAVLIVPGKSDVMIKQLESQPFESKGNIGFHGQHAAKKSKFSKNIESHEHNTLAGGAMPSPVASQTSYKSNSNKLIRIMNSRGRKSKTMKVAVGQPGFGIPWSTFEDQALVVLVHDMGVNWEFVSDVLNSTLHFKYIYRKPKDCKERHKFLMDRSTGDVADSAEDSSSSQPYPSTLPGIPKGSARQLFQRLQGPIEEDTLKSHFGKIILIGQHLHSCRTQNANQELKQVTPAHSSHGFALSQAYPDNLPGPILSPLDLCDAVNSSTDVSGLGYQGSQANGITHPGHLGSLAPVLRSSTTKTLSHGSPSMILGNGLPSPSSSVKTPPRDAQRYAVPRSTTLLVEDQQRLQNYNQILPGRNMQQSGMSVPGSSPAGVDRGVRMLHGANGMGMMCGVNRSMSMPRPGFQGVTPSSMLNMVSTNNMPPINSVGMPKPVSLNPNAIPDPGNSTVRPHDSLQMPRPGQSTEEHRQINVQEIQTQVSQGNAQAAANFNDMSAPFSNAMISPPVKTSSVQQNQSHQIPHMPGNPHHPHSQLSNQQSTRQQSYIRFAKERQLQQRMMPQVQHPYSGSTTTSPMQSIPQIQQQSETSPVNSMPSHPQHKQQPTTVRNPQSNGTISSQNMKQKQRQQVGQQQQPRNVQQQVQAQQQAKQMNNLVREPILVHRNRPVDGAHVGGLATAPRNQASEKHVMQQSRGFYSGSGGLNPNLPQPSNQQKLFSGPHTQPSKQVPMMPSHSDNNQASIQVPPSHAVVASQQSVASSMSSANQSPANRHRMTFQQDPDLNTDRRIQSTNELLQVKQIIPGTSVAQTSDPNSPPAVLSSGIHWKQNPSMETSKSAPMAQLAGSPQENHTENDAVIIPSSHGLVQRQLSGNISIHGHGTGGQWQQQQFLRSQPQLPRPPQQQNQHGAQGNLYAWPSNSRPG